MWNLFAAEHEAKGLLAEARAVPGTNGAVKIIDKVWENKSFQEIKWLAGKITEQPGHIAILALTGEKVQLILARSGDLTLDMNQIFKQVAPVMNGKGGGNPKQAQGGGTEQEKLGEAMQQAISLIEASYSAN